MRKFGLILLLGAAALFIVLPIALGSALLFEWDSMVIFLGLFRELFFGNLARFGLRNGDFGS